jgi:hypothetical protein
MASAHLVGAFLLLIGHIKLMYRVVNNIARVIGVLLWMPPSGILLVSAGSERLARRRLGLQG